MRMIKNKLDITQITKANINIGTPIKMTDGSVCYPLYKITINPINNKQEIIPDGFLKIKDNIFRYEKINSAKKKSISDTISDILVKTLKKILQASEKNDIIISENAERKRKNDKCKKI